MLDRIDFFKIHSLKKNYVTRLKNHHKRSCYLFQIANVYRFLQPEFLGTNTIPHPTPHTNSA